MGFNSVFKWLNCSTSSGGWP